MTTTTDLILTHLDEPEKLEALYRENPETFRESIEAALSAAGDSMVLRAWIARLEYRKPTDDIWSDRKLWQTIGIGLVTGILIRIPAVWLSEEWYYPRVAPMWIVFSLAAYFFVKRPKRLHTIAGVVIILVVAVYVSFLPNLTDSVVMALMHLPLLFWFYLGAVFLGDSWRDAQARIRFIRFNGELVVFASLLALGGMVLSGLTIALFSLVDKSMSDWYARNVAVIGVAGIPVIATYVFDVVFKRRTATAAVLARIFAPLFLLMVIAYLGFALFQGKNPFFDRDFLIVFNGVLMLVLCISVFSLVARNRESKTGLIDALNITLVGVTLLINAIALAAIVFRLSSFGFTPNRVAVLGANVFVFMHLIRVGVTYVGLIRRKIAWTEMERVIGGYLPVYGIWAVLVAFLLPLMFWFE